MKIIVAGAGKVGSHLAKMLSRENNEITVIDSNPARLRELSASANINPVEGVPSSIHTLSQAGVDKADLFIATVPAETQEVNVMSALIAKKMGAGKVIARINDENYLAPENKLMFKDMGIELLFYPERIAADEITGQLRHVTSAETMDFVHGKLQIAVFKLDEDSPNLDQSIVDFMKSLPQDEAGKFRVIAISRNGETIIPKYNTKFLYGDLVYVISTREGIDSVISNFGKGKLEIRNVMVMGGTPIGEMVSRQLSRYVDNVKLIESDRERCLELTENLPDNVQVICGDGRNSDFLEDEAIRSYDAFVALTPSDETNVLACVVARKFGVQRTIAEVENLEYVKLAEDLGIDTVINKKLLSAGRILRFTLSGKARFVRYMTGTSAEVMEYTVAPDSLITRKAIKDIGFPDNSIIGGVVRGSDAFIAIGDTVIEPYDRVAVFAMPDAVKEIDRFFK